jgi:hypothetical protein
VSVSSVGLPLAYDIDRGEDGYERRRKTGLRRDLAEYLAAVRSRSPAAADQLQMVLPIVPVAWCSIWLPHEDRRAYDRWRADAYAEGARFARALDVSPPREEPQAIQKVMLLARQEAERRFCPLVAGQRRSGRGPAELPDDKVVNGDDVLLDSYMIDWTKPGSDQISIPTDQLTLAYLDLLALPLQPRNVRQWPSPLPCHPFVADQLSGRAADELVQTIKRDNEVSTVHDRTSIERDARDVVGERMSARLAVEFLRC